MSENEMNSGALEDVMLFQRFCQKNCDTLLDVSVSSLRRGHANLLCIVPILADDPRGVPLILRPPRFKYSHPPQPLPLAMGQLGLIIIIINEFFKMGNRAAQFDKYDEVTEVASLVDSCIFCGII